MSTIQFNPNIIPAAPNVFPVSHLSNLANRVTIYSEIEAGRDLHLLLERQWRNRLWKGVVDLQDDRRDSDC
jgi:hypothetical protein